MEVTHFLSGLFKYVCLGNSFNVTKGDKLVGQNCETIKGLTNPNFFGIVGNDISNKNGVGISTDGGKTVKMFNISIAQTLARYGAFPSATTWYVAAGQFPSTTEPDVFKLTNRIHYKTAKGKTGVKMTYADQIKANPTPNDDWAGACCLFGCVLMWSS